MAFTRAETGDAKCQGDVSLKLTERAFFRVKKIQDGSPVKRERKLQRETKKDKKRYTERGYELR